MTGVVRVMNTSRLRLLPRPQLLHEHPHILRIIDRDHDQMHAALLEGGIQRRGKTVDALDPMSFRPISPRVQHEIRIAKGHAEIGEVIDGLFPADHAVGVVLEHQHDRLSLRRTAVSISWLFIMKPPSPATASTRRSGWGIAAIIADGRP